jgi:nitrogen regulatory protein P-II 1
MARSTIGQAVTLTRPSAFWYTEPKSVLGIGCSVFDLRFRITRTEHPIPNTQILILESTMTKIECVIRPERFEEVNAALADAGIVGMTTTEVRGCGRQRGYVERYRGMEYQVRLIPKMKVEVVVPDDQAEAVVAAITQAGRTGEVGDGKIFLSHVDDAVRIRTGERGEAAL